MRAFEFSSAVLSSQTLCAAADQNSSYTAKPGSRRNSRDAISVSKWIHCTVLVERHYERARTLERVSLQRRFTDVDTQSGFVGKAYRPSIMRMAGNPIRSSQTRFFSPASTNPQIS